MTRHEDPNRPAHPGLAQPSDACLREQIVHRLSCLSGNSALRLAITVREGAVHLAGAVGQAYEGKLVLHTVERIPGVRKLTARICVGDRIVVNRRSRSLNLRPVPRHVLIGLVALTAGAAGAWLSLGVTRPQCEPVVALPVTLLAGGRAAVGAQLNLFPATQSATPPVRDIRPRGLAGPGGQVEWTTFMRGDGLPPGDYIVTACWLPMQMVNGESRTQPNCFLAKYANKETSPLRVSVRAGQTRPITLEVETVAQQARPVKVRRSS